REIFGPHSICLPRVAQLASAKLGYPFLHEKMRGEKLRVWFAPEDMQGGKKLIEQIDRAIQVNDRVLLVLSEHSMNSEWVQTEIRKARQAELREQRQKLFPIRLVSLDGIRAWSCFDADT